MSCMSRALIVFSFAHQRPRIFGDREGVVGHGFAPARAVEAVDVLRIQLRLDQREELVLQVARRVLMQPAAHIRNASVLCRVAA